jgi:hypothetical protein
VNRRLVFTFDCVPRIAIGGLATAVATVAVLFAQSRTRSAGGPTQVSERALVAITGIPPASVLACAVIILQLAAVGFESVWTSRYVTLVEASRNGDIAGVYRLVSAGSDPNQSDAVRLEGDRVTMLTPLEAAVESRQVEVLQVLVHAGARASEDDRQTLVCLAAAVNAPEVADYLHSTLPPSVQPDCTHIAIPPY